jgi:hypothetical protein
VIAHSQADDSIVVSSEDFYKPNSTDKGAHYIDLNIEILRSVSKKNRQIFTYSKEPEKERKKCLFYLCTL